MPILRLLSVPVRMVNNMTTELSKSYKLLFEFSERLDALAMLFKRPVKDQQFAKILPRIYYEIDVIRHLEFILRERIFKGNKAEGTFGQLDTALYHAQYVLHGPDQGLEGFPSERYNFTISREISTVANVLEEMIVGQMGSKGTTEPLIKYQRTL